MTLIDRLLKDREEKVDVQALAKSLMSRMGGPEGAANMIYQAIEGTTNQNIRSRMLVAAIELFKDVSANSTQESDLTEVPDDVLETYLKSQGFHG